MENKRKIALVLDWSNLFYRSLFMNKLTTGRTSYDEKEDIESFIYKFATDVCALIKMFFPQKIFITVDAKHSWRKDISEDVQYKGNREKDDTINWENLYKASDDLLEQFRKIGANIAYVNNAEADDMMTLIKEVAFEECNDYNVIIVSADADIRQLIQFDETTHQYCVVYNTISRGKTNKRYIFAPSGFMRWVDMEAPAQCDIFFSNVDFDKQYIKDIINSNSNVDFSETDADEVVLNKIFCGDDGDNVPAFYEWYKNARKARVTPTKYAKIKTELNFGDVKTLCDKAVLLKPVIERALNKELDDIDVEERLMRQRRLVELNTCVFPDKITKYKSEIKTMFENHDTVVWSGVSVQSVLEGTSYLENARSERKRIEKSLFKDVDDLIKGNATMSLF